MDQREKKPKRFRVNSDQSITDSDDRTAAFDAVEMESMLHTVHLYEITVEPSQQGEPNMGELSEVGKSDCCHPTDLNTLTALDGFKTGQHFPLTIIQTVDALNNSGENTEVVVMSECPAGEQQEELANGITAAILTRGHELHPDDVMECHAVDDFTGTTEEFSTVHEGHETQVITYFETIPNVFPGETSQFPFSPDTVLSSALSSKPITSTLPIVSKYMPTSPTSLVLAVEGLDTEGEEAGDGKSEEDIDVEQQDHQLEEHWWVPTCVLIHLQNLVVN